MTSTLVVRTDLSGTSYILDVSALELSSSLSTLDYEVTHNGTIATSLYTKTAQTQLTYAGISVTLGTKVVARRTTPIIQTETTFISTTTASSLTNALEKLRLKTEELDARLTYTLSQALQGGITIGAIPVNNGAYPTGWSGDTTAAASRNSLFNQFTSVTNALALLAPLANPALTGTPTAPTPATSTNNTQLATTAYVKSQLPNQTVTGAEATILVGNVRFKYGTAVIVIASNTGSYNYVTSPAFTGVNTLLINNGDAAVTTSPASPISAFTPSGFTFNTSTYVTGSYRVNFLAIGV